MPRRPVTACLCHHANSIACMTRILIAPGAFKNSLASHQAAAAIEAGLRDAGMDAHFVHCPIADGGNGTLDAFCAAAEFKRHSCTVLGPLGEEVDAEYGLDGERAVIEMALASGLELCDQNALDPMRAHTYGTGTLIRAALDAGARQLIVGLGGSATVDGGIGCLQALGARFYDAHDALIPVGVGGGSLSSVKRIDLRELDARLANCTITIACDVDNPIVGEHGSAEVFAAQKGASPQQIVALAAGLKDFFSLLADNGLANVLNTAGAGAAGSIAGALMACCGGQLAGGFELWQEHSHFEDLVSEADLLITGEGRMDEQTIHGKGPMGAALIAKKHAVPAVALVGGLDADDSLLYNHGLDLVLPLVNKPMSLEHAITNADSLLRAAATRLAYALRLQLRS